VTVCSRRLCALLTLAVLTGSLCGSASAALTEHEKIVHLLNRAAFGPTQFEVEWIEQYGRPAWLDLQLDPRLIEPYDTKVAELLASYPTVNLTMPELLIGYPQDCRTPECSPQRIPAEQAAEQLIRSVHSYAQLREVMTDFWFNHFNIYAYDGPNIYAIQPYLKDVIRPHALGNFEELLVAVAQSVGMLYYLDNYASSKPGAVIGGRTGGINENYGRELMELHTISVIAGYTQQDVEQVARILTGWTISPPRSGDLGFVFAQPLHDEGAHVVLGKTYDRLGILKGLDLLHDLATAPATALYMIAPKLVSRFVADTPPADLTYRVAETFYYSGGDITATLRTILESDEFYDPAYVGTKAKTPLELAASSIRALGGEVARANLLLRMLRNLNQPPFACVPPTGYADVASQVLSAGVLIQRWEGGDLLANGDIAGILVDVQGLLAGDPQGDQLADQLIDAIIQRPVSDATRNALRSAARSGLTPEQLAGLVLSAPEFTAQ